jgi:hypothetical protein
MLLVQFAIRGKPLKKRLAKRNRGGILTLEASVSCRTSSYSAEVIRSIG